MAVYRNRGREAAERLIKLRDYLYMNATPTHAVKMAEILAYLASEGHEVEVKTVYRDLDTLKDFFHLDIDYDGRQRGYILKNPKFEPHELRMIVNSIQAAKFITQEEADRLTDKIKNNLADKYTRPSLKRKTYIPNRTHSINKEAMKGLDTIYEAITQKKKISFKFFYYTLNGSNKAKKYHTLDNSDVITASPYSVGWENNKFWIYAIIKVPKCMWYKADLTYDDERAQYIDDDGKPIDDIENIDFWCENMDESGLYVYDSFVFDLALMEQIKILTDKQEGLFVVPKGLYNSNNTEITKLQGFYWDIDKVLDKFGDHVSLSVDGNLFFIATIHEEPTPELYLWTRQFFPPIEIIYPEDAEDELRAYFLSLAKDESPLINFCGFIKPSFPYDD